MDRLSPTDRSRLMGNVRGKDTTPEMRVRKLAHALGYRFRLHRRDLRGSPDLVFPSRRKAIFVHGCFWHRHPGCRKASTPKTRIEFWQAKFARNVERDARNERELRAAGWDVLTIWECETRDPEILSSTLRTFLGSVRKDRSAADA
ncbi:very short patch repair endonuclease [Methylobacterium sp. J-030]|uniref:very short patch repair endonuclease n=1 Tax=Methylobacterium sp. J-030 TaxID=2836627 RepID=UPI001FBBF15C|nr:very short patch repair endonuclease [Methylobacterium sp. J-030]MCJ2069321.1 very short patch repair endonuclease [Methylobacterium sp. J-030]